MRCPACGTTRVRSDPLCPTCGLDFGQATKTLDPRDRFAGDNQDRAWVGVPAAIGGSLLGGVIVLATGAAALTTETSPRVFAINVAFLLEWVVIVPLASLGLGLIVAWAWDTPLRWATRLGSPVQDWRGVGQRVTLVLCGVVPLVAALWFMLVAPWAAYWTAAIVVALAFVGPVRDLLRSVWDTVK